MPEPGNDLLQYKRDAQSIIDHYRGAVLVASEEDEPALRNMLEQWQYAHSALEDIIFLGEAHPGRDMSRLLHCVLYFCVCHAQDLPAYAGNLHPAPESR